MLDKLLPYYLKELSLVRNSAKEFAAVYPKIAGHLNLESEELSDPHVARLIESFAFLTAHLHGRLDDDFADFANALLGVLYPHHLAPIPSCSIAKFETKLESTDGYHLSKDTLLDSEVIHGEVCKFSTIYPITVWPIAIEEIFYRGLPLLRKRSVIPDGVKAALTITLSCRNKELSFAKLAPNQLEFFINCQAAEAFAIYELIFNHALGFEVSEVSPQGNSIFLDRSCIKSRGFDKSDNLLPYSARTALGYRLLTEFFAFPQKFWFFELTNLRSETFNEIGQQLEITIYFNTYDQDLEQKIGKTTFQLGCTPIVNLFEQIAEPIKLDHRASEYQVIPDVRQNAVLEVYSVQQVSAITEQGDEVPYLPFYGTQHALQKVGSYWYAKRKDRIPLAMGANRISDVYLSFVDLNFKPQSDFEHIVKVKTYCTNSYLPSLIPFSTNALNLKLTDGGDGLAAITCLLPFTQRICPALVGDAQWKVVSHLLLNHYSITGGEPDGIEVLKEMLRIYDIGNYTEKSGGIIDSLVAVNSRRISARSPASFVNACCNGVEVALEVEESKCVGYGLFLFARVLEKFLAEYVSINSFVKLSIKSLQKREALYQWKPQAGGKNLL